jgi:D-alanyl-D-alanine carboxypeptidase/D-alanyl-D-alanine-endopeptidase (penicillin-binding protein 4)
VTTNRRIRPIRLAALLLAAAPVAGSSVHAQQSAPELDPAAGAGPMSSIIDDRAELAERLDRILADPALTRAHVGLTVQVAETGEVLYERAGEKRFTPASNTKIVTGAVGLDVLGPDYVWTTRLVADGKVRDGTLDGDLWIVGGGDPSLSRDRLETWMAQLRAAGIRRITGDVVADDRMFTEPQWGEGWMWDDLFGGWSAGVTGLQLAPNTVRAALVPGNQLGDAAELVYRDRGPTLEIANRVRTGAPGSGARLAFVPPPEGGPVELRGWVPLGPDSTRLYLATPHATLYLLDWVKMLFAEDRISLDGRFRRATDDENPVSEGWVYESRSEPLSEILGEMLKPSDNQMAETLLRTIAVAEGEEGSPAAGLSIVSARLADWGIEPGAIELHDGSGLSRYNEVTPNALARLLRAMWRHPDYATFVDALPTAGVDGTLRRRLLATPGADNVRAKTGSLSAVRALSGYLVDGAGETLVFSLLLNGYDSPGAVAVALEDLLIEQVALYRRPVEPGWPSLRKVP